MSGPDNGTPHVTLSWSGMTRQIDGTAELTLGRDAGCDLVIDNPNVSRRHAALAFDGGTWVLRDLGSTQGITVAGERVDRIELPPGRHDVILGAAGVGEPLTAEVTAPAPPPPPPPPPAAPSTTPPPHPPDDAPDAPMSSDDPLEGGTVLASDIVRIKVGDDVLDAVAGRRWVIGRDPDCDLVIDNPVVSRHHAELAEVGGQWILHDLGSRTGLFVEGTRVDSVPIQDRVRVTLGTPGVGQPVTITPGDLVEEEPEATPAPTSAFPAIVIATIAVVAIAAVAVVVLLTRDDGGTVSPERLAQATVLLDVGGGHGSGSIIDAERGLILTAAHVVAPQALGQAVAKGDVADALPENPSEIVVHIAPGLDQPAEPRFLAEVVVVDGYLDLAVVRIVTTTDGAAVSDEELAALVELERRGVADLASGDPVRVAGFPGVAQSSAATLTQGIISGSVDDQRLDAARALLNIDAEVAPGNSGGAAVDARGRLIGVPLSISVDRANVSKANRIRPVDFAEPLIAAAVAGEDYVSPYIEPLTEEEDFTDVRFVTAGEPGIAMSCPDGNRQPQAGDMMLALAMAFTGMPDGHQDMLVDVISVDQRALVGWITASELWPLTWGQEGCVTVTTPLFEALVPGDYLLRVHLGPNHEFLGAIEFTVQ